MITDADALAFDAAMRPWEFPRVGAGVDARWVQACVASQLADVLARLAAGDSLKHCDPKTRAWFRLHAEECVLAAMLYIEEQLRACASCGRPLACATDQCFDCWRAQGDGHP